MIFILILFFIPKIKVSVIQIKKTLSKKSLLSSSWKLFDEIAQELNENFYLIKFFYLSIRFYKILNNFYTASFPSSNHPLYEFFYVFSTCQINLTQNRSLLSNEISMQNSQKF
jgi:hypothetical protein